MFNDGIASHSRCLLVGKSDSTCRFGTDFRKVSAAAETDSNLFPRVKDCVGQVSYAR